jgi:tight adherence protein C
MPTELMITTAAVFVSVGLAAMTVYSMVLSRTAPELKRLRQTTRLAPAVGPSDLVVGETTLRGSRAAKPLRKPNLNASRLRRRLALAGFDHPQAESFYQYAQMGLAVVLGAIPLVVLGGVNGLVGAALSAIAGYMIPDFVVSNRVSARRREIQNGLPDALDLLVVCVEAGSSLDQAILRASEELEIASPAIATELSTIATEIRAGKPRLEAFQDFAKRTGIDDVRALVGMLIQTDRFGTSIAQALRTHAETSRTKRRQRAEERAGKVGVKMVFPLVLCLLPALYVVCLGPVGVRIYRSLF